MLLKNGLTVGEHVAAGKCELIANPGKHLPVEVRICQGQQLVFQKQDVSEFKANGSFGT
jgi:hypothetical protein